MIYKYLFLTILMTASKMGYGAEPAHAQNDSQFNVSTPLIACGAAVLTAKAGYHWYMYNQELRKKHSSIFLVSDKLRFQEERDSNPDRYNIPTKQRFKNLQESVQQSSDKHNQNVQQKANEHKRKFWSALKLSVLSAGGLGIYFFANKTLNQPATPTTVVRVK